MQDITLFIQQHGMLSLAFAIVLFLLMIVEFIRLKQATNHISVAQVTSLINHHNAVVVDIRNTESFAKGHIVDAISLPLQDLGDKYKKLDKFKSQPIVLVCAAGVDSARAATSLTKNGFNVLILKGGIKAWLTADMPIVKG
jgi:rhodanese-related sulfurtransferase